MNNMLKLYKMAFEETTEKIAETEYGELLPETSRSREMLGGVLGGGVGAALGRRFRNLGRFLASGTGAVGGGGLAGQSYSPDEEAYLLGARTKGTPEEMALEAFALPALEQLTQRGQTRQQQFLEGIRKLQDQYDMDIGDINREAENTVEDALLSGGSQFRNLYK